MYEAARINAAMELLAECEATWRQPRPVPADILIHRYFKSRRYIGSKDRGAIAALCYLMIRHYNTLNWYKRRSGLNGSRVIPIIALLLISRKTLPDLHNIFNGERFFPPKMDREEGELAKTLAGRELLHHDMPDHVRYNYPDWLDHDLKSSLGEEWKAEIMALNAEAPVDLRVNTLLATRDLMLEGLRSEHFLVEPTELCDTGIRMHTRAPVFTSQYFRQGWFEMQDEGSQIASRMINAKAGQKIIDFCAGAGGKTLAIAALMQNKGRILAWDVSEKRLEQMKERLRRARVDNVQLHVLESEKDSFLKRHSGSADGVVVDAPCSGSGTWRRNPDLKWRFTPAGLRELIEMQKNILGNAAKLVKPGGHLLYITCSFLQQENEGQIDVFLQHYKNFRVVMPENLCSKLTEKISSQGGFLKLSPYKAGTDGFFAALLQRSE